MATRLGLLLGILALGAGCDFEPVCTPLVYNRATDLCECPMGAPYDPESGGCLLPDGGVIPVDGGGDAGTPATDACTPVPETCNGLDDDCDGAADEAAAAAACEAVPGATRRTCTAGECVVLECASGRDDCNGDYADGCEAELATDDAHCGGCGLACDARRVCVAGACEASPVSEWVRSVEGVGRVDASRSRAAGRGTVVWGSASGTNSIRGVAFDDSRQGFVAYLDAYGEPTWLLQPSGPRSTISQAIASEDGTVVVCGEFETSMALGGRELVANSASNGFVASIDATGNVAWLTRVSATIPTICGAAVLHDGAPHIALLPNARGMVSVGTASTALDAGGAVIVRLDAATGAALVRTTVSSTGYVDITVLESASGMLFFGGTIGGAARFSEAIERDATGGYVSALDGAGQISWVSTFQSGFFAPPRALLSMPSGALVVGGYFYERVSIDTRELETQAGATGAYVARLDATNGASRSATSLDADLRGMVRLGDEDVLIAAWYDESLTLAGETRTARGPADCALVTLRGTTPGWLASLGTSAGSRCDSLSADGTSIVLAGTIAGPIEAGVVSIPHSAGEDGFVWRFRAR